MAAKQTPWHQNNIVHVVGMAFVFLIIFGVLTAINDGRSPNVIQPADDTITSATSVSTSQFRTGATMTQYSIDAWGDPAAVVSGRNLLLSSTDIVNQHIMGFGALNPEPSPDQYDFTTIVNRIGSVSGTAKDAETIVLTACCAPDWMKGGNPGETDWTRLEEAPFPEHYDDFAELVGEIVQHPELQNIEYLQVWNEMKGMWNPTLNRWDHEGYTELYNKVWDTVKAVRPDIKIGGPYVVMGSWGGGSSFDSEYGGVWGKFDQRDLDVITYWLQNKRGADFIVIDGANANRNGVEEADQFGRTEKFADFMPWLRGLDESQYPGATTLPVWWAEWYARTTAGDSSPADEKNALMTLGLMHIVRSGASTGLVWDPQGDEQGLGEPLSLFTDTRVPGGGQPTLFYQTQQMHDHFGVGTQFTDMQHSNSLIKSLSSPDKILLVNTSDVQQGGTIGGESVTLDGYEVRLIDTPASTPTVTVNGDQDITTGTQDIDLGVETTGITVDRVEVYVNSQLVRTWNSPQPPSYSLNIYDQQLPNGDHTLSVTVYDAAGASTQSSSITMRIRHPDISRNQTVDIIDLSRLLNKWQQPDPETDLNADGLVTIIDLSMLLNDWAQTF